MKIFEKLDSVDAQMENELQNLKIERQRKEEQRRKLENEIKLENERRKQDTKVYKIQKILEDNTYEMDEPHLYEVSGKFRYEHRIGVDGGHYVYKDNAYQGIMTEREKQIAEASGNVKNIAGKWSDGDCLELYSLKKIYRELTAEEEIKMDAIRKKASIIKTSEDVDKPYVANFYTGGSTIKVPTTLKGMLLSSLNVKNVEIEREEEKHFERIEPDKMEKKEKSGITLGTIKKNISMAFSKGER